MPMATKKKTTRRTLVAEIIDEEKLAGAIGEAGFSTTKALANASGVNYWTLIKNLTYGSRMSPKTAHALADVLSVNFDDYFTCKWLGGASKTKED